MRYRPITNAHTVTLTSVTHLSYVPQQRRSDSISLFRHFNNNNNNNNNNNASEINYCEFNTSHRLVIIVVPRTRRKVMSAYSRIYEASALDLLSADQIQLVLTTGLAVRGSESVSPHTSPLTKTATRTTRKTYRVQK